MESAFDPDWTRHPEARTLLARCAADPPRGEWKRAWYPVSVDEWYEYRGRRVARLQRICDAVTCEAMARDAAGHADVRTRWAAAPATVHDAIWRAIRDRQEPEPLPPDPRGGQTSPSPARFAAAI